MKMRSMIMLMAIVALATIATATPVVSSLLCAPGGTFQDLINTNAGGGCFVQDKLFSDFTYQANATGGAIALTPGGFNYLTVANAPAATGFQFGFALSALNGQSNDVLLGYLISYVVTGPNITSNHVTMVSAASPGSAASVGETFCKGGPVAGCLVANTDTLDVTHLNPADSAFFAPVNRLGVLKNISVIATTNGFATISGLVNTVDQEGRVPEPGTLSLMIGAALAGLAFVKFRKCRL